jgi:hypothetical protein
MTSQKAATVAAASARPRAQIKIKLIASLLFSWRNGVAGKIDP